MWLDNASNIDMLFYSPYADTIVNFTKNTSLTPLTIGLYGSWGAGKSSLLQLIEQRIAASGDGVVCVSLNAWQFEGYEDAKIAIMESLLNALKDNKTFAEKSGEKIKGLLSRIDYLKLGKKLLKDGAPYLIGALTGNPLPIAVNLSADLSSAKNILGNIKEFKDEYIKDEEEKEPQTENIRKFREEFQNMLNEVSSVNNLVVIVDDLDRCSPDRIVDTLEAIKLFLSVKKTTFIVAVDQRIIEYAVNIKYPQVNGFEVSTDYIEKIIQLPTKIPELSPKDIENYLLLLVSQLHLSEDSFKTLIAEIYAKKMMIADKALTVNDIDSIITEKKCTYKSEANKTAFEEDAVIIMKISSAVSSSLKGNPRQAKRFLNTFFVRKNLASLYFGEDINLSIMAKLLALETIEIKAFRKLYEWNSSFNGEIKELKAIEKAAIAGKDLGDEYILWANPRVLKWLLSEPKELYNQDLSKYFYLSREALSSVESVVASFNEAERNMLSAIQKCMKGQESTRIDELKNMHPSSQHKICDALMEHFKSDTIGLNIMSQIYVEFADCRGDIIEAMKQKSKGFFAMGTLPHLHRMYKAAAKPMEDLVTHLESKGYYDAKMIEQFKRGIFIAIPVERSK